MHGELATFRHRVSSARSRRSRFLPRGPRLAGQALHSWWTLPGRGMKRPEVPPWRPWSIVRRSPGRARTRDPCTKH
jgi:hypothetical protein